MAVGTRHDRGDHISVLQHPNKVAILFVAAPNGTSAKYPQWWVRRNGGIPYPGWFALKRATRAMQL